MPPKIKAKGITSNETAKSAGTPAVKVERVRRDSLNWKGNLGQLVAYKMQAEYKTKYLTGNSKIRVAKQWAEELGIISEDPQGHRTKAYIANLCKKFRDAKLLSRKTGFGDITRVIIGIDGKETVEVVTALKQLNEICPHYEILESALGDMYEHSVQPQKIGLTENGLTGGLELSSCPGTDSRNLVDDDDEITDDDDNEQSDIPPSGQPPSARKRTPFSYEETESQESYTASTTLSPPGNTPSYTQSISSTYSQGTGQNSLLDIPFSRQALSPEGSPSSASIPYARQHGNRANQHVDIRPSTDSLFISSDDEPIGDLLDPFDSDKELSPKPKENSKKNGRIELVPNIKAKQAVKSGITSSMGKPNPRKRAAVTDPLVAEALDIKKARLRISELKYKVRSGEKTPEQYAHELELARIALERETKAMQTEEYRYKQLQLQSMMGNTPMDPSLLPHSQPGSHYSSTSPSPPVGATSSMVPPIESQPSFYHRQHHINSYNNGNHYGQFHDAPGMHSPPVTQQGSRNQYPFPNQSQLD
ncbi:hypothetical protein DFH27DRAFT_527165 [Peziza echinospora]|nr:hypothetical protein DFH27DRAFT_527165 [Peziza echinospora]